jgi:DNA mismatch repair protein MutL
MDAYFRQITPGEYPLIVLMLNIKPDLVDVNVHPSKLQVKFLDSQKIYQIVYDTVYKCLSENKISYVMHDYNKSVSDIQYNKSS